MSHTMLSLKKIGPEAGTVKVLAMESRSAWNMFRQVKPAAPWTWCTHIVRQCLLHQLTMNPVCTHHQQHHPMLVQTWMQKLKMHHSGSEGWMMC
jgi:hypothetical protein